MPAPVIPISRNARHREVRARTENTERLPKRVLEEGRVHLRLLAAEGIIVDRPRTRGECIGDERPCPFVSCRHHLYLDVENGGTSVKLNFPDLEPDQLDHSCSLDVADEGGLTLDEVGRVMNVTRERIRQIGDKVLERVRRHKGRELAEFVDGDIDTLDRSNPMGQGGRLGEGARIAQQVAEQDEPEDAGAYSSSAVWPADPRDLREEHDALASERIWSAYLRDSHGRGIGVDLTTAHAKRAQAIADGIDTRKAAEPQKEQPMARGQKDTETPGKILAALNDEPQAQGEVASATGLPIALVRYHLQRLVKAGQAVATGTNAARRFTRAKGAPPASRAPTGRAPRAAAAAVTTAKHGAKGTAIEALLALRAKAQAKVEAFDELLEQLGGAS